VALTGISITSGGGTIAVSRDAPLSGQEVQAQQDFVTALHSPVLTGLALPFATGSLGTTRDMELVGESVALLQTSPIASFSFALSGLNLTLAQDFLEFATYSSTPSGNRAAVNAELFRVRVDATVNRAAVDPDLNIADVP
jgi:hypothetical protein